MCLRHSIKEKKLFGTFPSVTTFFIYIYMAICGCLMRDGCASCVTDAPHARRMRLRRDTEDEGVAQKRCKSDADACCICQHTSAYVCLHVSAYVSLRQQKGVVEEMQEVIGSGTAAYS
jgi:hypothetical protein